MLRAKGPIAFAELRTRRLLIRPVVAGDREAFVAFCVANEAFFSRYSPPPPDAGTPEEEFAKQLARTEEGLAGGTAFRAAVWRAEDTNGEIIGMIALSDIVRGVSQRCNMGYRVAEGHARRGYGLEMARRMLTFAFADEGLGLHRVECCMQPENEPSLRLAEKAGFRREGFAPRFLYFGGEWRDHILMAKTAEEHEA